MNDSCVIYARFSSHGQNEQSIESQIRTCTEFAESKGLKVVNVYSDKAKTGTNDKRPDFQLMMKDAASGTFKYIIVYMMDRFSRNRRDSIMYKEMLKEKYGVKVLSALEPISEDEGGEFYEMFLEWNAEKYSKRLSKRIKDGIDTSIENGTYCGGKLIYGYKLIDTEKTGKKGVIHKVEIDEEQAKIVKYVFEQYDKGVSKKKIAATLNEQGYRYYGKPFVFRNFEKMLRNQKYTGEFTFGGRSCINIYPAIIDKALFESVQEKLDLKRYVAGGEATAKVEYLLTGKLYCGHCGTKMISDGSTGKSGIKYHYYSCKKMKAGECNKHREKKEPLEEYVVSCVVDFLSDRITAEMVAEDVIKFYEQRTGEQNIKSIAVKIATINKEVDKLTDSFVNATSTLLRSSIEKKMTEYEILLDNLYAQKVKLELERGFKITKQDLLDFIQEILSCDKTDFEFQKSVIDNLVSQVYVSDDNTVVYFNLRGGKNVIVDDINLEDTKKAINGETNSVQTLSPLVHHCGGIRTPRR